MQSKNQSVAGQGIATCYMLVFAQMIFDPEDRDMTLRNVSSHED
jgi:hypothetical protein